MSRRPVHYELFSRRIPQGSWVLEMASEDRQAVLQNAEDLLQSGRAAVRVCKETFDAETGEFNSLTLFEKGSSAPTKPIKAAPDTDTICTSPQDLYTPLAREKMARLLEDWLKKQHVTPFELLHRPDLVERLESGSEILHAVQKLSVPESHETGQSLHELMRRWSALFEKACTRLIADGRKGLFAPVTPDTLISRIDQLKDHPERAYVLGGGLAAALTGTKQSAAKLECLLKFALVLRDQMNPSRLWAMPVLEAPVIEIFNARTGLSELLGREADLGDSMAVMTRLVVDEEVEQMSRYDARIGQLIPPLQGNLAHYHSLIKSGLMSDLGYHITTRLMQELKGPLRLKPNDPEAEIEILRALALCMSVAGRDEGQREDITEAFNIRSKKLVTSEFVTSLLAKAKTPAEEVSLLIWLCENMVGTHNKRQAARWLKQIVAADAFERHMRDNSLSVAQRLLSLAKMQARIHKADLVDQDGDELSQKMGQVGHQIATDARILAHILRGNAPALQKLSMLLSFASGQSAPFGLFSDQAKVEAITLLRDTELRNGLLDQPDIMSRLKPMLKAAGVLPG
ncbi:MAG: hypothetical protein WBQ60_05065 [Asticcacaulis sp.]